MHELAPKFDGGDVASHLERSRTMVSAESFGMFLLVHTVLFHLLLVAWFLATYGREQVEIQLPRLLQMESSTRIPSFLHILSSFDILLLATLLPTIVYRRNGTTDNLNSALTKA